MKLIQQLRNRLRCRRGRHEWCDAVDVHARVWGRYCGLCGASTDYYSWLAYRRDIKGEQPPRHTGMRLP